MAASSAALRALRRRLPAVSPARILPYSLPGPCHKDGAAAVVASLQPTRGVHSSPTQVPSMLRSYCSAGGGSAAANLPAMRRSYAPSLQAPSLGATPSGVPALRRASPRPLFVPRRAYSSEEYDFLEEYSEEEILEHLLERMEALEEKMRRHERFQWIMFVSLEVLAYLYYLELPRLDRKIVALREEVAKLNPDSDEDDLA